MTTLKDDISVWDCTGKYHGDLPNKMSRIVDGHEIDISGEEFILAMAPSRGGASTAKPLLSSVLRTDKEKRPTVRYEPPTITTPHRSGGGRDPHSARRMMTSGGGVDGLGESMHQDPVLLEFERSLPTQMIYAEVRGYPLGCKR